MEGVEVVVELHREELAVALPVLGHGLVPRAVEVCRAVLCGVRGVDQRRVGEVQAADGTDLVLGVGGVVVVDVGVHVGVVTRQRGPVGHRERHGRRDAARQRHVVAGVVLDGDPAPDGVGLGHALVPQRVAGGGVDHDEPEFVVHPHARAPTDPQTAAREEEHLLGAVTTDADGLAAGRGAGTLDRAGAPEEVGPAHADPVHRGAGDVDQPAVGGDGRLQSMSEHGEPSGPLHVRQVVGATDVHVVLAQSQRPKVGTCQTERGAVRSHEPEGDRGGRRVAAAGEEPAELGHDPGRAGPRVPLEDRGGPERTRQSQLCACRGADRQRGTIHRGPRGRRRGRRSLRGDRRERGSGEQCARDRGGHRGACETPPGSGRIGHRGPLGNVDRRFVAR